VHANASVGSKFFWKYMCVGVGERAWHRKRSS